MANLLVCFLTLYMAAKTFGLVCYQCSSSNSAEDCERQQKLVTCSAGLDYCHTSFTSITVRNVETKAFIKNCTSRATCDTGGKILAERCKDFNGTCTLKCCDKDFCNSIDTTPGPTLKPNKCYKCSSEKSWDDCDQTRQEITCPPHQHGSCGKVVLEGNRGGQAVKLYAKDCVATQLCSPENCKFYDLSLTNTECDLNCCTGDLCNGAEVPMVNVIILLACAIITFLH